MRKHDGNGNCFFMLYGPLWLMQWYPHSWLYELLGILVAYIILYHLIRDGMGASWSALPLNKCGICHHSCRMKLPVQWSYCSVHWKNTNCTPKQLPRSVSDFERFFQFSATRTPPEAGDAHDFRGQVEDHEDHSISLTAGVGIFRGP